MSTTINNEVIYQPGEVGDKQLVSDLIVSLYADIALAMRAQQRRLDPGVLDLAEKLETSHTKLAEELKLYASGKGWLIPAGELDRDVASREEMAGLDNATYQRHWLSILQARHQSEITRLENATPTDSKLQSLSEKTLSELKEHLGDLLDVDGQVAVAK